LVDGDVGGQHFDVVVVGSGFGGSISAYRLAEAGRSVCVLERGKAYAPHSFPRSPAGIAGNLWDPSAGLHGMFDVWSFKGIDALVSSGLGGGSLIYANVLIRKDPSWFVQDHPYRPGVTERWPVQYEDLEPSYERIERFLDVQTLPVGVAYDLPKTRALREAAASIGEGVSWSLAPLGVRFRGVSGEGAVGGPLADGDFGNLHGPDGRRTCRLCGECDIGCNDGAKSTLDHTYLSAASHHGAVLSVRSEVRALRRTDRGFDVDFVVHRAETTGTPTDTAALPVRTVHARQVVLAAGTLGSTYLVLRNRRSLGISSPALGTRFCGNGDLLGFIMGAKIPLEGSHGPVISSYIRSPDAVDTGNPADKGSYLEDAGYPAFLEWLAEATQVTGLASRAARLAWERVRERLTGRTETHLSASISRVLGANRLSNHSVPVLGMGRDAPDGLLYLRGKGTGAQAGAGAPAPMLDSTWTMATSEAYFSALEQRMHQVAAAVGGRYERNPLGMLRRVITVHPLGGLPMGDHPNEAVVDGLGRAHGVEGLYVADGSVMPGPVGPNPSLTIAAFADRMCDRMVGS
jgi:cholesterol oxidase